MPDAIADAKRALRADLRERRQQRSDADRAADAVGVATQLDALVERLGARSVSCFLSTPTEPGTQDFIRGAVARGIRVLLPITREDGLMDWAVADPDGEISEGLYGVPEPVGDVLSPLAVNDVDLLIVPAAAVDRTGMRMGWGRGYFDRALASMTRPPAVFAVVFDHEVLEHLPTEPHDVPLTGVVTPRRTLLF